MATDFRHILVPVDFGASSARALDTAIELARKFGSKLTLLHVYEIPSYVYATLDYTTGDLFSPIEDAARKQLDETLREVRTRFPEVTSMLRRGSPAYEIIDAIAEVRPDLVVIGTHGRRGIGRAVLGSVAERVVRSSPAPVLTVRGA